MDTERYHKAMHDKLGISALVPIQRPRPSVVQYLALDKNVKSCLSLAFGSSNVFRYSSHSEYRGDSLQAVGCWCPLLWYCTEDLDLQGIQASHGLEKRSQL